MPKDGEKLNWQGNLFSDSCEELVSALGYQEKETRIGGKDMLCEILSDEEYEKIGLVNPLFAPYGTTLFSFTSDLEAGTNDLDELRSKIEKVNKQRKKPSIIGGVIITNKRMPEQVLKYGLEKDPKIYCWDYRTTSFLSFKLLLAKQWSKLGATIEIKINEKSSFLRCLESTKSDSGAWKLRIAVFFHNPLDDIGSKDFEEYLKIIIRHAIQMAVVPANIEIFAVIQGYPQKDLFNQFPKILEKFNKMYKDKIVFTIPKRPIIEFYTNSFIRDIFSNESSMF